MKRVLVTGGGGFVGQWLARALLRRGDDVALGELEGVDRADILNDEERRAVRWVALDVRDPAELAAAVDATMPDVVVHLAGVAFPPAGERAPAEMYDVNTLGAVRLLSDLARRRAAGTLDPSIVVVGSGVQYGDHDAREMPLHEDAPQRPRTVYGASKAAQEVVALQMARAHGLRVVCTRSFNHSGIGHGAQYLLPSLVRRVTALGAGSARRLTLGNDAVRDYLHVADVADAYIALADRGAAGEAYNVASGIGLSVRQLARDVLLRAGVDADISTDPALVRSSDVSVLVGSPDKLVRDTGWTPARTHLDIIDDLLRSAHAATH